MKTFITRRLLGTEVAPEDVGLEAWEERVRNQSTQVLRNTGRIEQLEAGQADLKQKIEQLLTYLQEPSWKKEEPPLFAGYISYWCLLREIPHISRAISRWVHHVEPWDVAQIHKAFVERASEQLTLQYRDELLKVAKLFGDLEKDFDELPRRIVRCELLEKGLAALEDSLEGEETESLGWCVSLIRDVLDYNYAEDLTETQLGLLGKAIDLIYRKGPKCDKEDCQNLHKEFLEAGLVLIPTSQKAIDKYGR